MGGLLHDIAHAGVEAFIVCLVLALYGLWVGFRGLQRSRLIEDVPTAKIRSAPQGRVELVGKAIAMDGDPIIAPLSKVPCCWYRYRIERRDGRNWRLQEAGESEGIFILRDDTGDCIIDPDGAEVTSVHGQTWYAGSFGDSTPRPYLRFDLDGRHPRRAGLLGGLVSNVSFGFGRLRFTESVILGNDPLYAIGRFKTLGATDHAVARNEITRAILRDWKADPEALLDRFDADGDGRIDMQEWDVARAQAGAQAAAEQRAQAPTGPLHMLGAPSEGHRDPFMLSNLPEFDLVGHFTLRKWLGFSAFLLAGGAATLMAATGPAT